jgi:hypothetical protein
VTAESSLGDAKSSLGDAKSSLGDAESSLGDAGGRLGGGGGAWVHGLECVRWLGSSGDVTAAAFAPTARLLALGTRRGAVELHSLCSTSGGSSSAAYGDGKVANREILVWHGATDNGP